MARTILKSSRIVPFLKPAAAWMERLQFEQDNALSSLKHLLLFLKPCGSAVVCTGAESRGHCFASQPMAINQRGYVRRVFLPALLLVLISARAAPAQKTADQGAHAPTRVSSSIEQLRSPELQQRRDAARELAKIAPMPPEAIEALAQFLETGPPKRMMPVSGTRSWVLPRPVHRPFPRWRNC